MDVSCVHLYSSIGTVAVVCVHTLAYVRNLAAYVLARVPPINSEIREHSLNFSSSVGFGAGFLVPQVQNKRLASSPRGVPFTRSLSPAHRTTVSTSAS